MNARGHIGSVSDRREENGVEEEGPGFEESSGGQAGNSRAADSVRAPSSARTASSLRAVLVGVALGLVLTQFGVSLMRIQGHSMDPTLSEGQIVVVLRPPLAKALSAFGAVTSPTTRGAMVVTPDPRSQGRLLGMGRQLIVKRVIGQPLDSVTFHVGHLSINGAPTDEPWVAEGYVGALTMPARQVPEDSVFIVGDNRRPLASNDSRQFGPVPVSALRGVVVGYLVAPWGQEGGLRWPFASL